MTAAELIDALKGASWEQLAEIRRLLALPYVSDPVPYNPNPATPVFLPSFPVPIPYSPSPPQPPFTITCDPFAPVRPAPVNDVVVTMTTDSAVTVQ